MIRLGWTNLIGWTDMNGKVFWLVRAYLLLRKKLEYGYIFALVQ